MRLSLTLPFLLLATAPAYAGATAWQELGPGARVRLITSDRLGPDGTTLAAVELEMPQDMKTYWRVPGETGIPAELDFSRSTGVAAHRFIWPYPQIEKVGGYTDFVYYGPIVLPVELKIDGGAAHIEASLLMGICSEICIPATAEFSLPLNFTEPDTGQEIRIAQALAETPMGWSGSGEPMGEPLFDPAEGLLWVPFDPATIAPDSIIAEAAASGYLFGAPQKSQQPGLVSLPLLPSGDGGAGLMGAGITLLFVTPDGPFEVERRVGLAPDAE
jgi:DsbC/DsbD-like thiol-disulfide interchange protein